MKMEQTMEPHVEAMDGRLRMIMDKVLEIRELEGCIATLKSQYPYTKFDKLVEMYTAIYKKLKSELEQMIEDK